MTEHFIFPDLDPVAIKILGISVRWYSLAYVAGFMGAWYYLIYLSKKSKTNVSVDIIDELFSITIIGLMLGARIGYVIFYEPLYYIDHPLEILKIYEGGLSFHGGLIGICIGIFRLARKRNISFLALSDLVCATAPFGIALGRIANFVNGELYGKPTSVAWAIIFQHVDFIPRHPSQFYEAFLEGFLLLILLNLKIWRRNSLSISGIISSYFLIYYSLARFTVEFFRESEISFDITPSIKITMGQILCIPMFLTGIILFLNVRKNFQNNSTKII